MCGDKDRGTFLVFTASDYSTTDFWPQDVGTGGTARQPQPTVARFTLRQATLSNGSGRQSSRRASKTLQPPLELDDDLSRRGTNAVKLSK